MRAEVNRIDVPCYHESKSKYTPETVAVRPRDTFKALLLEIEKVWVATGQSHEDIDSLIIACWKMSKQLKNAKSDSIHCFHSLQS